ncbi:cation channel family protein (macronuclear) [Tetrahymena thermophila SB210]|uniref:Cation channel family protein n=1 Tax=Tetrahymena thermophila (strain SB210) TaxID=312017 RepID=Q22MR2_TETTS|nr:cation channel family protein [Tetrahymena thermophila SB210]EAR86527.2 cation channel family protein [Tetrahymena thermophila SB210]|eukprot:XP_976958.2 cation channel family protein [Tetrahymena thermophila SB210]
MSSQKVQKTKNRYSKSQQFEPLAGLNRELRTEDSDRKITDTNLLLKQNMTTQSDYENAIKTQEVIIDTEVSQHALMHYPKNGNNNNKVEDNVEDNEEDNDVFDILYGQIQNDKSNRQIQEDSSKVKSDQQNTKPQQYETKKSGSFLNQDYYELQNMKEQQASEQIEQYSNGQNNQDNIIRNAQSINIRIPLQETLDKDLKIDSEQQKNIQELNNKKTDSMKNSRFQNQSVFQDKLRYIQNLKNRQNKEINQNKRDSLALFKNATPSNQEDSQQEINKKLFVQNRKTLQGTVIINEGDNTNNKLVTQKANQNWNMVKKLSIMMRFKQKLNKIIQQRLQNIKDFHHRMIGDCTDAPILKMEEKKENIKSLYYKIFLETYNPESLLIIYYKIFITLYTLFNVIYLPLIFGFDLDLGTAFIAIHSCTIIIFLFEIYASFRIQYYHLGELVTDRNQIYSKYLNNKFITDLITIIALVIGYDKKPALLFILVKIRNILSYLWDIDNHYYLAERYNALWILIKLFGFIAILCHYFACIFHYTGMVQEHKYPDVTTWTREFNLIGQPWSLRYNYSIYFSFITCITIGYGDITPKNTNERNIVILISLISTGCFSYSVNTMATVFQDFLNKSKKSKEMRYDAINYMRERNIHKNLQLRVLKYIEYIYQMEAQSPDKGLFAINQISGHLKAQLFQDYYGKIIIQDKHFSLNYSKETIDKLSLKMKERIYGPGEIIFDQGEQDTRIFFLMKGEIEYYYPNRGNKQSEYLSIFQTQQNQFFGYKGFISGIPREMTCRSINITQVFYCTREDLVSILKENPLEYEKFCKLRDEYLLQYSSLGEKCFSCNEYGHTISDCYKIRYVKNKELLILKKNYSANQVRQFVQRSNKKYATFLNMSITSFEAIKCKLKNVMQLQRQHLSEEVIDKIIIQEQSNHKRFCLKYPSIKLTENCNEILLGKMDEPFEYSTSDSDSNLSQISEDESLSEQSSSGLYDLDSTQRDQTLNNIQKSENKRSFAKSFKLNQEQNLEDIQYDDNENKDEFQEQTNKVQKIEFTLEKQNSNQGLLKDSSNYQITENNQSEQIAQNLIGNEYSKNTNIYDSGVKNKILLNTPQSNNPQDREYEITKQLIGSPSLGSQEMLNRYANESKAKSIQWNKNANKKSILIKSNSQNQDQDKPTKMNSQSKIQLNRKSINNFQKANKYIQKLREKFDIAPSQTDENKYLSSTAQRFANVAQELTMTNTYEDKNVSILANKKSAQYPQYEQYNSKQMNNSNKYETNENIINFYQGQINRLGQFLNYFQNQQKSSNKIQVNSTNNLANDFQNQLPPPPPRQHSINKTEKQESSLSYPQKRMAVLDLNEFLLKANKQDIFKNFLQDEEVENNQELFYYDFDFLKEFTYYFPQNNHTAVCLNYKRIMKKLQQSQRKNIKQINVNQPIASQRQNFSKFKKDSY